MGSGDGALIARGKELAEMILTELPVAVAQIREAGVISQLLDELVETVAQHVHVCCSVLRGAAPAGSRMRRGT
jgi:hypothetical protein